MRLGATAAVQAIIYQLDCMSMSVLDMSVITAVVLLASLTITEGMNLGGTGMLARCRCISTEKKRIGHLIDRMEVIAVNSHCDHTEIIATLKRSGIKVCLDASAPWVKRVLDKLERRKPKQRKRAPS